MKEKKFINLFLQWTLYGILVQIFISYVNKKNFMNIVNLMDSNDTLFVLLLIIILALPLALTIGFIMGFFFFTVKFKHLFTDRKKFLTVLENSIRQNSIKSKNESEWIMGSGLQTTQIKFSNDHCLLIGPNISLIRLKKELTKEGFELTKVSSK